MSSNNNNDDNKCELLLQNSSDDVNDVFVDAVFLSTPGALPLKSAPLFQHHLSKAVSSNSFPAAADDDANDANMVDRDSGGTTDPLLRSTSDAVQRGGIGGIGGVGSSGNPDIVTGAHRRRYDVHGTSTNTSQQQQPPRSKWSRSKWNKLRQTVAATRVLSTSDDGQQDSIKGSYRRRYFIHPTTSASTGRQSIRSRWNKLRQTVAATRVFATPTIDGSGVAGVAAGDSTSTSSGRGSRLKRHELADERRDSFLKRFSTRQSGAVSSSYVQANSGMMTSDSENDGESRSKNGTGNAGGSADRACNSPSHVHQPRKQNGGCRTDHVFSPDGGFMFAWRTTLTVAILYNLWTCIAREAFPEIQTGLQPLWFALDALADFVYLLDIGVQTRTGYLERGLVVYDLRRLAARYFKSRKFVFDVACLAPIDFVQFYVGIHPLLRFPRFLKVYRLYRFVYMVETRTVFPNVWRVVNLSHVLFLGCHWFAAFYYLISKAGGFRGKWGYPEPVGDHATVAQKYLRSLHWSTLTLTTIGDLEPPESNWEFLFTIVSYLIGVFIFATIVGQVGNVITNRNASRHEFERHLDGAKAYMRNHNVPREMQQRVQRWYDYAWSRGRINGGGDINSLGLLPDKLKTELALHVNLETLRKVTIFHQCEPEFLHDLVLKMKAYIFTPGDLICRKGEVAREMFIIADGLLEVISESGEVLKQMNAGDFFGEIGILNLDGGVNRRTADVRSVGYSELFVLSRDDVLAALKDHPEAEVLIKTYGRKRLQELDDHKRRHLAKVTADVEKGGAVLKMVSSSTGLIKGMMELSLATCAAQAASMQAGRRRTLSNEVAHQQQQQNQAAVDGGTLTVATGNGNALASVREADVVGGPNASAAAHRTADIVGSHRSVKAMNKVPQQVHDEQLIPAATDVPDGQLTSVMIVDNDTGGEITNSSSHAADGDKDELAVSYDKSTAAERARTSLSNVAVVIDGQHLVMKTYEHNYNENNGDEKPVDYLPREHTSGFVGSGSVLPPKLLSDYDVDSQSSTAELRGRLVPTRRISTTPRRSLPLGGDFGDVPVDDILGDLTMTTFPRAANRVDRRPTSWNDLSTYTAAASPSSSRPALWVNHDGKPPPYPQQQQPQQPQRVVVETRSLDRRRERYSRRTPPRAEDLDDEFVDVGVVSGHIGGIVADFVEQQLVSRQAEFDHELRRLEAENASKQRLIDRLKATLDTLVTTSKLSSV